MAPPSAPRSSAGSATSPDLVTWQRTGLLLQADSRWYQPQDWRDPWVQWDPATATWHMYLCASANDAPADGHGVVGHLTSADLESWTTLPPVAGPERRMFLEQKEIDFTDFSLIAAAKWSVEDDHLVLRIPLRPNG